MKTTDIFTNRSPKKLNEALHKTFGKSIRLEQFTLEQLQDARNKLRTQLSQVRSGSGFNETVENEAYLEAQWMLDAINAELAERAEHIVDESSDEEIEEELDEQPSNKGKLPENTQQGEGMKKLREGEIQQASAIVTAKTMVDRIGRWIEELSGMENETLLQLGDQVRDEMGQEAAKAFISTCAPAIQQALENLKQTRDTVSSGVRSLATGEAPADMLGAEPTDMGGMGDEMGGPAEPDMMNGGDELGDLGAEDDFAAAEPGAGGLEAAGREQRESIQYQNSLLRVLAG